MKKWALYLEMDAIVEAWVTEDFMGRKLLFMLMLLLSGLEREGGRERWGGEEKKKRETERDQSILFKEVIICQAGRVPIITIIGNFVQVKMLHAFKKKLLHFMKIPGIPKEENRMEYIQKTQ